MYIYIYTVYTHINIYTSTHTHHIREVQLAFSQDSAEQPFAWIRIRQHPPSAVNASEPPYDGSEVGQRDSAPLVEVGDGYHAPLGGVIWSNREARAMLSSSFLYRASLSLGRKLRLLDIATGLGLNLAAALKSGHVDAAVGLELSQAGVARALHNVRLNRLSGASVLRFDACRPGEELWRLLGQRLGHIDARERHFDVVTMSFFSAPPEVVTSCAYELMLTLCGPSGVTFYLDGDSELFRNVYSILCYDMLYVTILYYIIT